MNYFDLATTSVESLQKMKEAEAKGDFSSHLDPIDYSDSLPVDENFPYIPSLRLRFNYFIKHLYFLNWFTAALNRKVFKTKIVGKENLKNIKGAVVICNHINKYDGLVVKYALRPSKLKIMVADFNNRKGFLGDMMRASGILPFSTNKGALKQFMQAIPWYLSHKTKVLFFPEGSEWWEYEKPRPMMDGAFHYAAASNVPIIPLFITFRDSGKVDKNNIPQKYFTVNISKPIYPNESMTKKENTMMLKQKSVEAWDAIYTQYYC